jgi:hypothetical protein
MGNISADDKDGEIFSVRGNNAYVVSAGSIHPKTGQPYEVVLEPMWGKILTAPDWLVNWLLSYSKKQGAPKTAAIPEPILEHSRNKTLTSLAGVMRRPGMSEDAIFAGLQVENQQRCHPPLPEDEVRNIARSVAKYEPAETVDGSEVESVSIATVGTKDMPESVLDGWLGQICKSRMLEHFPVAYAWPALVTVASAMVPTNSATNGTRCNLYTALVGPIHSGKSEAIKHAKLLLGIQSPPLLDLLAGSAEMLTSAVAEAAGQPRLYSPDELGHLLEKAQIQNSSFVYVLNRAFYETGFKVRSMEKKRKEVSFNAILSVVGGIVEDRFSDLYAAKSTGGFYDRGLYSLGPTGFRYEYMPFEGGPALQIHRTGDDDLDAEEMFAPVGNRPIPVRLDKSVFAETNRWRREDAILKNPDCNRVVEIALRVATICASFDRRPILYGKDLGPAFELARYQARVRGVLKPNPGRTYEGQLYHKFFECLTTHTSDGSWMARKDLFHRTRAYEVGLPVATKTLDAMIANDDVEGLNQTPPHGGRVKKLVRIRKLAVQL